MLAFVRAVLARPADVLTVVDPAEAVYLAAEARDGAVSGDGPEGFLAITQQAQASLREATQRLHRCVLLAVDHVLADDRRLARFGLHPGLWPLLRWSWQNQRSDGLMGRFDFCWTDQGLKLFEYNADSAGCLFEVSRLQGSWSAASGLPGACAGAGLLDHLLQSWRSATAVDLVHLLHDSSDDERCTVQLMKQVVEAAGQRCKLVDAASAALLSVEEPPRDADGEPIRAVWKTWSWRTIVQGCPGAPTRLARLLLPASGLQVFEPFWKILVDSKAILPVLCELFPEEPCLLPATDRLREALAWPGFVVKPLDGRGGAGVRVCAAGADPPAAGSAQGRVIYQAFCPLPIHAGFHVQLSSFCVGGRYAGAGIRRSRDPVLRADASCVPLRVLPTIEGLVVPDGNHGVSRR
jgi:glutathionylspermidine amidase/synthetase